MKKVFGGLGAWGMFAALLAVCALMFTVTEASEKQNAKAYYQVDVGAPSMPLIVASETTALCGTAQYILLNETRQLRTALCRSEVSPATPLLLSQVATDYAESVAGHPCRWAESRSRAGPTFACATRFTRRHQSLM